MSSNLSAAAAPVGVSMSTPTRKGVAAAVNAARLVCKRPKASASEIGVSIINSGRENAIMNPQIAGFLYGKMIGEDPSGIQLSSLGNGPLSRQAEGRRSEAVPRVSRLPAWARKRRTE